MTKTHKVTVGIFKGYEFNGSEITINGVKVVWDNESNGRSSLWRNVHRFRSTEHLLNSKHQQQ